MFIYLSMIDAADGCDKFEQIYHGYGKLMYHVAYKILKNHHDAEDAVHQAFVSIIKHLDKIREIDSAKTRAFIVIITERKAIDILRTSHRDRIVPFDAATAGISISLPGDFGIADAIARLPASYREVLMLKFDYGFTSKEIAKMLGISESGVRHLICRARKALQKELNKEGIVIG